MIAIDANLLLYVYTANAPEHERASAWLEAAFSSSPQVGLPLVSVLAFIRITTDRRLSDRASSPARAGEIVSDWPRRDDVLILEPGPRHWPMFFANLSDAGATGARVTNVHIATLAIEHGATLHTNDRDFRIFPQLDVRFPLRDDA